MSCNHNGLNIYDHHTGDEICAECGLVINDRISFENEEYRVSFSTEEQKISVHILNLINDVCANNHLNDTIKFQAIQLASKKVCNKQNDLLAAYSIYISLIEADTPKLIHEVASFFDLSSKHLWSYIASQSTHFIHETKPSHISPQVFIELDIPFKLGKMINTISDDLLEENQFAPSAILSAVILCLVNERLLPPISPKSVTFTCNISLSTARRVKKVLEQSIKKKISREVNIV